MRTAVVLAALFAVWTTTTAAQEPARASVVVTVTTQNGSIHLPGVTITLTALDGHTVASGVSDGDGIVRVDVQEAGRYQARAELEGFDKVVQSFRVDAGATVAISLDMPIAGVTERVDVIGNAETAPPTIGETLSTRGLLESRVVEQLPIRDHSVLSALKLLAGVVDGPGGVSIKGGRSNQSGLQIGMTTLTDSSTGAPLFRLPVDAIGSVEVLPNPYAVEFGRFSSGLTIVNTKRAGDVWRAALNSPDFSFRAVRGSAWKLSGIESFGPRIGVGGPLIKGHLFLEQSAQMRYDVSEIWSRPPDEVRRTLWLSTFTRVDAVLAPGQSLIGTLNVFPSRVDDFSLSTFNGPDVAADQHDQLVNGSVAVHTTLGDALVLESTVQLNHFRVDVTPHGAAPMELAPAQNTGNFFNQQDRSTQSVQWVEEATGSRDWKGLTHLFKVGVDLMHSTFNGTSASRPVDIRLDDGTLVRRLTFTPSALEQHVETTDVAAFAQDRVQPHHRLLLEFGGRVDRDGVLGETNLTPRVGAVFLLNASGSTALRGGYGWFFERTPSVVGAFHQFETTTDTRYSPDGATPLSAPQAFTSVSTDLELARSTTWNVELSGRLSHALTLRAAVLERVGANELVVNPISLDATHSELLLTSGGRSRYLEGELTARYAPGPKLDVGASYVRSSAYANLNAYTAFYDNLRWPVIGADAYAPTANNTPNRLVTHSRTIVGDHWLVSSILEVHSGFPYSVKNAALDWVGPRNQALFFPTFALLDLDLEHKFTFLKGHPWIGVRVYNALNRFTPTDVQANLASAAFGSFYNLYGRQIRLQIRFD